MNILPWWGWPLCAVVAGIMYLFLFFASEKEQGGARWVPLTFPCLTGIVGVVSILVAAIRFLKWVSTS
jgi:uncharacterized membrane protein